MPDSNAAAFKNTQNPVKAGFVNLAIADFVLESHLKANKRIFSAVAAVVQVKGQFHICFGRFHLQGQDNRAVRICKE